MAKNNFNWDTNDQNRNIYNTLVFVFKKTLKIQGILWNPVRRFSSISAISFSKKMSVGLRGCAGEIFHFFLFFYIWWSTYTNLFSVPRDKLPKQFSLEKSANEKQIQTVRQFLRNNQRNWHSMILNKLYQAIS